MKLDGRWKEMLIVGDSNNIKKCSKVNFAKVKDIRWDLMKKELEENLTPYEKFCNISSYHKEFLKQKYPTEEDYKESFTRFSTYAVLTPDGEWYEPGVMGWWGISSATPEQESEFEKNYEEKFLRTANPEWTLTIVDCHI